MLIFTIDFIVFGVIPVIWMATRAVNQVCTYHKMTSKHTISETDNIFSSWIFVFIVIVLSAFFQAHEISRTISRIAYNTWDMDVLEKVAKIND